MSAQTTVPDGYMQNAAGHLVPEDQVRDHDKLRDSVATDLATQAIALHEQLRQYKWQALSDLADLVSTAATEYDVKIGGDKGNLSITTFDGAYKIQRAVAERIEFTEEIHAAKAIFDDCIKRWSEGANANLRVLVDRAFRTDKQGQLKTTAILELLRIEIEDADWQRGVEALKDSIQVSGTVTYIRVYKRVRGDRYEPVPLDLAAV
ncbi:DUF3164 family protein [Salinisphaera orenii]|uniref:Sulfate transporter n=1 Tax=Salinisphaera orenii YIM 95161 TaxID=1051139 RepID=A0A423PRL4_9GAMM|nr:DUF3164 family protein [Salinisphaera halophila]ROO28230.1 sulfate transporter [Salinisphaera halophila YIM 95161]